MTSPTKPTVPTSEAFKAELILLANGCAKEILDANCRYPIIVSDIVQRHFRQYFTTLTTKNDPCKDFGHLSEEAQGVIAAVYEGSAGWEEEAKDAKKETAAQSEKLRIAVEALSGLVEKLEVIHADERYKSVWTLNQMRAGPYAGPKYDTEFEAAKSVLTKLREDKS